MLYGILGVVLLAADQWVKYWTVSHLALGEGQPFLPGFLELRRVHNYGAAWSSFSGMRWALVAVTAAVVLAVTWALATKRIRHPLGKLAAALIISGGIGNLVDRIRLGYVVDMFNFLWISYPVFNVADMCVVSGAILGALWYLKFSDGDRESRNSRGGRNADGTGAAEP